MDFLEIYDQYYSRIRKFIVASVRDGSLADDLVQETFLKVRENLDRVRDPQRISSWAFRIAHNLCQDHYRNRRRSPTEETSLPDGESPCQGSLVQKEFEQRQMGECVQGRMNQLPESLRTVLILFDVMELDQREIAEILDTTPENVRVRLHRARKRLKAILEKECSFEVDERSVLVCALIWPAGDSYNLRV